ncbi:hypothetical protein PVAP13_7KG016418 [Panicum virgatum]|uniref:Uncharacterized protein n=1 Tax=Panicum virgatum TaxID=38727 RepID=A0A8T0QBF9_PANVG|nr:hypothetical protein PVAP13_7KG016418 [Panicum virgatum]
MQTLITLATPTPHAQNQPAVAGAPPPSLLFLAISSLPSKVSLLPSATEPRPPLELVARRATSAGTGETPWRGGLAARQAAPLSSPSLSPMAAATPSSSGDGLGGSGGWRGGGADPAPSRRRRQPGAAERSRGDGLGGSGDRHGRSGAGRGASRGWHGGAADPAPFRQRRWPGAAVYSGGVRAGQEDAGVAGERRRGPSTESCPGGIG